MFRNCLYLLFCFGLFIFATPVQAATLYFDPGKAELYPGDTIVIAVRINTDVDECINVVDGVISFDPSIQPVDISRGQSILPLWVEEPTIDRVNNRITFAGGIPNGYCGRVQGDPRLTNELFKIVFQVPGLRIGFGDTNPTTTIEFTDETTVYLNDGEGTPASLLTLSAELVSFTSPGGSIRNEWSRLVTADNDLPQQFSISLVQEPTVFSGKYYIVFNTTDKQTGIAYYEVMEEPLSEASKFLWGRTGAPWLQVKSPYVLKDQSLNSTIRVRAVDKAGNEYVATLIPEEAMRSLSIQHMTFYGAIAAGMLLILAFVFVGHRWYRRQQLVVQIQNDEDEEGQEDEDDAEEEDGGYDNEKK